MELEAGANEGGGPIEEVGVVRVKWRVEAFGSRKEWGAFGSQWRA